MGGDGAPVDARPGHQTSASNRPHCHWCSHVQVTAYRRAPYALLSTLRPADEVGAHEPFTGSLLPNSARILLRLLRLRRNKRRPPDSGVSYHTSLCDAFGPAESSGASPVVLSNVAPTSPQCRRAGGGSGNQGPSCSSRSPRWPNDSLIQLWHALTDRSVTNA